MLHQYDIAGMLLNINSDRYVMIKRLCGYETTSKRSCNLNIDMRSRDVLIPPRGELIARKEIIWLRKYQQNSGYFLYYEDYDGELLTLVDVDEPWENGRIQYLNSDKRDADHKYSESTELFTHMLLGVIFRYCLLYNGGLVVHASTVKWRDKGIAFSAPSGTGKSTHVKLWQERLGGEVKVLNDDTPALRFIEDKPYIFGTPWSGSSHINSNDNAPLTAIILLDQAPVNAIRRLSIPEALVQFMPRVFLPYFSRQLMKIALNILDDLMFTVPIYLLRCRPDYEAVEMVMQCVM